MESIWTLCKPIEYEKSYNTTKKFSNADDLTSRSRKTSSNRNWHPSLATSLSVLSMAASLSVSSEDREYFLFKLLMDSLRNRTHVKKIIYEPAIEYRSTLCPIISHFHPNLCIHNTSWSSLDLISLILPSRWCSSVLTANRIGNISSSWTGYIAIKLESVA